MSPITHFLLSYCLAEAVDFDPRDRAIVTVAGVAPDVDGLVVIADVVSGTPPWYSLFARYHHTLAHNIGGALITTAVAMMMGRRRWRTGVLAAAAFHLHLFCDVLGSRGPDGDQWPIPYLLPFSNAWQWTWEGQWELNAWPNILITLMAMAVVFFLARRRGYSPIGIFSAAADNAFVGTLRERFPIHTP